jgi:hypothetical protein
VLTVVNVEQCLCHDTVIIGGLITSFRRKFLPFKRKRSPRRITLDCFRGPQSAQKDGPDQDFRGFVNLQSDVVS